MSLLVLFLHTAVLCASTKLKTRHFSQNTYGQTLNHLPWFSNLLCYHIQSVDLNVHFGGGTIHLLTHHSFSIIMLFLSVEIMFHYCLKLRFYFPQMQVTFFIYSHIHTCTHIVNDIYIDATVAINHFKL